jgi:maltose alpha-D-glucosyltransferase / alpha-amylase
LSLPGTPIIYYGDEIGMGDNIYLGDRNGVRTPMQWSADRNAGFSRANPQKLYLPVIIDPEYHYEAVNVEDPRLGEELLDIVKRRRRRRGRQHRLEGFPALALRHQDRWKDLPPPTLLDVEQSNTSWRHGDQLVGKLYRRLESGVSPDLLLNRHLSDKAHFQNVPSLAGHLAIRHESGAESTLALFQAWVPNQGSAWDLSQRQLEALLDLSAGRDVGDSGEPGASPSVEERIAIAEDLARLLGQRTGEMHAALNQPYDDPEMASEQFTPFARRSYAQAVRNLAVRTLDLLEAKLDSLPGERARQLAERVLGRRDDIERRARAIAEVADGGRLIRCHGDYHLGQVLYTGSDFVIIDFEGEPGRPLADRRRKRSPLTDVAGMLRSFHYAMEYGLRRDGDERAGDRARLEEAARRWYDASRRAFLEGYFAAGGSTGDLLPEAAAAARMLDVLVLEKALYEIGYELNNRPDWIDIPLRGLSDVLAPGTASGRAPESS